MTFDLNLAEPIDVFIVFILLKKYTDFVVDFKRACVKVNHIPQNCYDYKGKQMQF